MTDNNTYSKKQEIFSENKRKEKVSSLRDFKIHSNGLSPNTSMLRGKNILRDTNLDHSGHHQRKEGLPGYPKRSLNTGDSN